MSFSLLIRLQIDLVNLLLSCYVLRSW